MAYVPIAGFIPSFRNIADDPAADYWLKGYIGGTTTPLSMATDKSGATTLAKCKLNSAGESISNASDSGSVFIPFFDQTYRLALYFSEADADANNNNRKWLTPDIPLNFGSNSDGVASTQNVNVNGINVTENINNAANRPVVKDAIATNFNITDVHAKQVTVLTEDTAKTLTLDLADITIDNAEIWFRLPYSRTTSDTFVAGTGTTTETGWTQFTIAPGKTVGLKRVGNTSEFIPLGCWL